jgi:hypothetical protein
LFLYKEKKVVAFVVMAILLPILTGKELGRKTEATLDTMAADQPMAAD